MKIGHKWLTLAGLVENQNGACFESHTSFWGIGEDDNNDACQDASKRLKLADTVDSL